MFSSGAGSWAAAKRTVEHHGASEVTLLFADTNTEDADNYRFLHEAAANVGAPLVVLDNGGRTIWDVFHERRFLGNTRADPCSDALKRKPMRAWLEQHCDPDATAVVLGFGWEEAHRFRRAQGYWEPWRIEAPMCDEPYLFKPQVLDWLRAEGIEPPRLYAQGFEHANCGGGCVKAGQAQFRTLLRERPDTYAEWEAQEQAVRDHLGADVSILRDRTGGDTRPLTLRALRERLEREPSLFDAADEGSCSCLLPPEEVAG